LSTSAVAVCCGPLEIAGLRLNLIEQSHVLDRYNGLVSESLHEVDLPLCEQARLGSAYNKNAFDPVVAQQRCTEQATGPIEGVRR
jgi:hypothetical protein